MIFSPVGFKGNRFHWTYFLISSRNRKSKGKSFGALGSAGSEEVSAGRRVAPGRPGGDAEPRELRLLLPGVRPLDRGGAAQLSQLRAGGRRPMERRLMDSRVFVSVSIRKIARNVVPSQPRRFLGCWGDSGGEFPKRS